MPDFDELRAKYPVFSYDSFSVERQADGITVRFEFSVDGLCRFSPQTTVKTDNLEIVNAFDSPAAKEILFSLGLVEAVSYWKATCSPTIRVRCGSLTEADRQWWKKLWFNGLGEFFYRNGIDADFDAFVSIECDEAERAEGKNEEFICRDINIIPIGGGKDSAVTLELMKGSREKNLMFTVNDQPARTQTALAAGYGEDKIIRTYRTIDKNLLDLNSRGFLNGHTPFSAIVAFLACYCGYLTGARSIILSNESSANEANLSGASVNHQYSKSYEFESDFTAYVASHFSCGIRYFSLLRPFNELQIAKQFAAHRQYHSVFRSCNAGSKKNIWCCSCAKCLFVFIILSPFLPRQELEAIFGCNMLDKRELETDFDGLCGINELKPFECVGTVSEVRCALNKALEKYEAPRPCLLERYAEKSAWADDIGAALGEFNEKINIPQEFMPCVREMFDYVSATD